MRLRPVLLLILLCAAPAFAFEPYLVKDINPDFRSADSALNDFGTVSGWALFAATTPEEGRELWASNGTEAGTILLADLCPGECSGNPRRLAVTPRGYFFTAFNGSREELWVTQGTPVSTIRLAEVQTFPFVGFRWTAFVESRGLLFFLGDDGEHGLELWRTDGTPAGTFLADDIRPGPQGPDIREMWTFAGRVFFGADDGTTGRSLWASDGTPAGTRLVKDTWPGNDFDPEGPTRLRPSSRWLYFFARGPKGRELWKSDGTARGTQLVADLVPGPGSLVVSDSRIGGNRLFFVAQTDDKSGWELWTSDGTARGTRRLTSFANPRPFFPADLVFPLLPLGNRLVFTADDGVHGQEIWVTDGTPKGTRLLLEVLPGSGSGVSVLYHQIYKGRLLFIGTDGRRGQELWTTDGTPQGTRMIRDICRGSCSSSAFPIASLGDQLLLIANDGRSGTQIWKTDGTPAGTVRVSGFEAPSPFQNGVRGAVTSGRFVFSGSDDVHGEELWVTDGTAAGTGLLADLNDANQAGSGPGAFMRLGDELVFVASDGQRRGLWKSDGSAVGTTLVHTFDLDPEISLDFGDWEEAGDILYFQLRLEGESFPSLWRTDGTDAGTFPLDLGDLNTGGEIRAAGGKLFFGLRDEAFIHSLGVTDGTQEGTRILTKSDWYATALAPRELTSFQNRLFFFAGDSLWVSDGTDAGTIPIREFEQEPSNLTVHQGFLYFYAESEPFPDRALWRSDGTAAGTVKAADLPPHFDSIQPLFTTSSGPLLFLWNLTVEGQPGLWASDGTTAGTRWVGRVHLVSPTFVPPAVLDGVVYFFGREGDQETLWRSDGTSAGTHPVLDPDGFDFWLSNPIAVSGGLLFFAQAATDVPLWRSDGTAAGTAVIRDLFPGIGNNGTSAPPFALGPRIFFQAYDPATGTELWAIDTRED